MTKIYVHINGHLVPREEAFAPIYDHGLLYGDGLFEGIRSYGGRVFKLDEHLARLYFSARAMAISMPVEIRAMRDAVLELCRANDHRDGYIRLTVTRGTGLGLDPKHMTGSANVYISTEQLALYPKECYENGLSVVTVATRITTPDSIDSRVKCTGKYTNSIRAKMEANLAGAGEGLMLSKEGFVAECTGDNIFVVKDGVVRTPPSHACGLEGITRNTVLALAAGAGIPAIEEMLTQYDVYVADESFLTGTGAEVIPAISLDGRAIGNGSPGPIGKKLIQLFREHTRESGVLF